MAAQALPPVTIEHIHDVSSLYEEGGFQYSLPKAVLQDFLRGTAFGRDTPYSAEEQARLNEDIADIAKSILGTMTHGSKQAIISAGSPGAGKTTLLRQIQSGATAEEKGPGFPFVSIDSVCLASQKRTFVRDIEAGDRSTDARSAAYAKWRPASNGIAHLLVANLVKNESDFIFESTSTHPLTFKFLEWLKARGYSIKLIHVSASDDVRCESIAERDKEFIQTTEEDIREKGEMLPQRITDTFLKYADEIAFYFRPRADGDAILAAEWIRTETGGTMRVVDTDSYEGIKAVHNGIVTRLGMEELLWEKAVEESSEIK